MEEELRVILIDDEILIRKLIRMKMNTKELHLNIVGEFSNGLSALEKVEELKPDIVISDICMPEVDGISFSEQFEKILPDGKIIIVTGYDDFEYARRSLKAGVFDYLLKPIQSEELNRSLERASVEIRKKKEQSLAQNRFLADMKKNLPSLRSIYLNQLMLQEEVDEESEKKLMEYGITKQAFESGNFQMSILAVRESIDHPELTSKVGKEAEQFFESDPFIWVIQDSWGRIVIINSGVDQSFLGCLELLLQLIEKKYGCELQWGISARYSSWREIHEAYISALDNAQQKHGAKNIESTESGSVASEDWKKVVNLIQEGRVEEAISYVRSIMKDFFCETSEKSNMQKATVLLQKLCIDAQVNQTWIRADQIVELCRTMNDLQWAVIFFVRMVAIEKAMENEKDRSVKIGEIISYMQNHLDNAELSMNLLAEKFFISTSYLTRLFRTVTGESYGELLSDFRLLKMMELLSGTDWKAFEIGKQIGINDAHYLSIWFRKMTGYSVTEYRKIKD